MGDNRNNRGESKDSLYRRYMDMKSRCLNKNCNNYKYYGERGIKICDEWLGEFGYLRFKQWAMKNGYHRTLQIDRIDNDGNYEPNNCRWVTRSIQSMTSRHHGSSGYVGISKTSDGSGWYGRVKADKKVFYTGYSRNLLEAIQMRNNFIIQNGLPNRLNEVRDDCASGF